MDTTGLDRYIRVRVEGIHRFDSYLEHVAGLLDDTSELAALREQFMNKQRNLRRDEMEIAQFVSDDREPRHINDLFNQMAEGLEENPIRFEGIEFTLPNRTSALTRRLAKALDGLVARTLDEYAEIESQLCGLLRADRLEPPLPPWAMSA